MPAQESGDKTRQLLFVPCSEATEFENVPIEDRKSLIKTCISRITIDGERRVARFYVRRITAGTPQLRRLFEAADDMTAIVAHTNY